MGAAATVGAVFGGAVLGRYADLWGRRKMAMITMVLFAVISIFSGFAWSVVALIAIRFALGVAIGADYPTGARSLPSSCRCASGRGCCSRV